MSVELLDLKNDFVFKQVFGTEENKDVLISFINAVIRTPIIYDGTEVATDKVKVYMLSLPKFDPQTEMEKAQKDLLTKWMTFLKRPENGEILENKEVKKSYKVLEVLSRDKEAQEYYEAVEKWESVREAELFNANAKGKAQGLIEGEKKGRAEGENKKAIETAKNLLNMGLPPEQISKATGLSVEKIKKL